MPSSRVNYGVRFLESETAYELGYNLDDWYNIPRIVRETMIATRLARGWIDMLVSMERTK